MANSGSQLSLEILIKTIADREGARLTDEAFKNLQDRFSKGEIAAADLTKAIKEAGAAAAQPSNATKSVEELAKSFSEANAEGGEFANTISKLTNDQLLALEEKLRADIKALDDAGKSSDALKEKLSQVYNTRTNNLEDELGKIRNASDKAGGGVESLRNTFNRLKSSSSALQQILNGLEQGGIGGLLQALRGLSQLIGSLAGTAIGTILLPALTLATAAFVAMQKVIADNRAEMEKWGKESKDRADAVKTAIAELEKASAKSLSAQIADVEKLAASYGLLTNQIERSKAKTESVNNAELQRRLTEIDAREKEALEKAKTPEAQAGVTKKFEADRQLVKDQAEAVAIENKKLSADVEAVAAKEALDKANSIIEQAAQVAAEAARAAQEAIDKVTGLKDIGVSPTSQLAKDTVNAAQEAKAKADQAAENERKVRAAQAPLVQQATEKLEDAEISKQLAELAKQKLEAERRIAASNKRVADAKEKEARIAEEMANGASKAQAEARERPNQGGTITVNGQTKQVGPASNLTTADRAAAEAITASQKPVSFTPEQITVTPGEKAIGRQKLSQSDNFSGEVAAGFDQIAGAIDQVNIPDPPDNSPVLEAVDRLGQAVVQYGNKSNANQAALEKRIGANEKAILALQNGLQARNEASQS